jgi:hypothetical protein
MFGKNVVMSHALKLGAWFSSSEGFTGFGIMSLTNQLTIRQQTEGK